MSNENKTIDKNKIKIINKVINKVKRLKFKKFRNKYLTISKEIINGDQETKLLRKKYDFYIVGSDQVWNTDITNSTKAFFLDFIEDEKKISYAASYGKENINEIEKQWSLEELPKFNAISVREESARNYLKQNISNKVETVCDPVFLLKREQWEDIFKLDKGFNRKYIFLYYMEETEELKRAVQFIKSETGLPVIAICGGGKSSEYKNLLMKGPIDFLRIIRNADFVITNSFHAIAFSIIFEKKFMAISHSKWNVRLENLLANIESENKIVKETRDIKKENIIDGKDSYKKIINDIESSKKFLSNALK